MTDHGLAVVVTVITCRCGVDVDGLTSESAWQAFNDHLAECREES
jgi:hypothetical protein